MTLTELRKIAAARTPGEWPTIPTIDYSEHTDEGDVYATGRLHKFNEHSEAEQQAKAKKDQTFIATMANHIDALLAVVEEARKLNMALDAGYFIGSKDLAKALAELEAIK